MKHLCTLVLSAFLLSLASPPALAESAFRRWSVYAGGGPSLFRINRHSTTRVRPFTGIEFAFPFGLTLGNHLAYQEAPFGPGRLYQTSLGFRLGYWLTERLQLVARYDVVDTKFSGYNDSTHEGFGFELNSRLPIDSKRRFVLLFGGGWSQANEVTLSRDTGRPITNSAFTNSLCELFTLGLASGCGNVFERLTIPKSSYWHANVAVAWTWGR